MKKLMLEVVIEKDRHGYFVYCPALQGCYIQGDTYEDAVANIKDAIRLHLEDRKTSHQQLPAPESISVATFELTI